MRGKDSRAPYNRNSDDDQSLDTLSEEADYYPDVKENALGSIDYNPVGVAPLLAILEMRTPRCTGS